MKVQAKFRVHNVDHIKDQDGKVFAANVHMSPVYSADPASENYSWSQATPGGNINMYITNPAAFEQFELNKEYLVTFDQVG